MEFIENEFNHMYHVPIYAYRHERRGEKENRRNHLCCSMDDYEHILFVLKEIT